MATIAVFLALGGASYAAVKLPRNSVDAAQIRTDAVRASEIRRGAVGASELGRGAVGAAEIRAKAVASEELRDGAVTGADLASGAIPGPVLGYALVRIASDGAGDVEESSSLNITDDMVRNAADAPQGFFCFRRLPFAPRHVQATVQHTDEHVFDPAYVTAAIGRAFSPCAIEDEQAIVQTASGARREGVDRSFFVIFFG